MNKKINALANLFYRMHGCQVEMGWIQESQLTRGL